MSTLPLETRIDGSVGRLRLNRPDRHNAFDDRLIADLSAGLRRLGGLADVRMIVLEGAGRSFSAGADLGWMRRLAAASEAENLADARALAALMETLAAVPKPTVAAVHGNVFGGGVGLVAACDIAIAADDARFALSEVRLGLIPAVISPYVVRAVGSRAARRFMLTGEVFSALEAQRIGLVHEVVPAHLLEPAVVTVLGRLADGGPQAQAAVKTLLDDIADRPASAVSDLMARRIAAVRASEEGREGVGAFLEKRSPGWRKDL